ncbi:MAG TPA: DUF2851 family protein [Verrucomicrobiales bacterium]|nr:DUF2851 family protein [Verrucomicrobiales bacterium]
MERSDRVFVAPESAGDKVENGDYASFRARLGSLPAVSEQWFPPPPSELELQSRWHAGEFGRCFQSTRGQRVEIVEFGAWNRGAGPDFHGAVIRIGSELHHGDVELDPAARDWERHGHLENPAFDGVVLHVFLEHHAGGTWFTRTSRNREVCQVKLDLQQLVGGAPAPTPPEVHAGLCAPVFAGLSDEAAGALLQSAAQFRMRQRMERLSRVERVHGADQALFLCLGEALGYRRNRIPMRVLAQELPLQMLRGLDEVEAEAALFGRAGFLEGLRHLETDDPAKRAWQRRLWSAWWKDCGALRDARTALRWSTAGVRPLNHPQRRLGALCALVRVWDELRGVIDARPFDQKRIHQILTGLSHPFWNIHYSLHAEPSPKPLALLGGDRILDILANCVFPRILSKSPQEWPAYLRLRGGTVSEPVRRAALRFFGSDAARRRRFTSFLHTQQALLQLDRDVCLAGREGCGACDFPERLADWAQALRLRWAEHEHSGRNDSGG